MKRIVMEEAERASVIDLDIWQELLPYLRPQKDPTQPRAHFTYIRSTPYLLVRKAYTVRLPCPGCGKLCQPFRSHRGANGVLSLHPSGLRSDGHNGCAGTGENKKEIVKLQMAVGQATETPRIQKEIRNRRQPTFSIKMTDNGPEFVLDPSVYNGKKSKNGR